MEEGGSHPAPSSACEDMADILIPKWKAGNGSAFMKGLERHIRQEVDMERYEASKRAQQANLEARALGNAKADGLGQLKAVIPAREWFRWNASHDGCWQDKGFVREFIRDNPEFRGEGVKP